MVDYRLNFIVSVLLFLCACSSENIRPSIQENGYFEYDVVSSTETTKTTLADNGSTTAFNFVEGDEIGLFIGNFHANNKFTCTDRLSGTFSAKMKGQGIEKTEVAYCSYYPYREEAGFDASALGGVLPCAQKAPFDPCADYMIATPIYARYKEDDMPSLSFSFSNHLFGIVKLSVKDGSSEYSSEKILSIGLKSSYEPLAGNFTFDITDPTKLAEFSSFTELTSKNVYAEYSEDSAPIIGDNITHSVYVVVNPASFATGELSLELSTTNFVFTIPIKTTLTLSRNKLSILPVVDISSSSVARRNRKKTIVLWGDSITGDAFYKAVQKELGPNWNVVRGGVAGDIASQVAGRQGGLPVVSQNSEFTIPGKSSEYVVFEGIYTQEGDMSPYNYKKTTHDWTFRSGYCPLINPMIINGVECEMTYVDDTKTTVKIHRCQDGDDVVVPSRSPVSTFGSREYANAEMIVVYIGTNGRPSDASNDAYLISVHNAMASHLTNSDAKMMVLGFHQSPTDMPRYWTEGYITSFTTAFGDYFIDQRTLGGGENAKVLMKEIGQITDESQISTSDMQYINRGDWPISWFRAEGDVHPNDKYGSKVMAILVRRRMDELGIR